MNGGPSTQVLYANPLALHQDTHVDIAPGLRVVARDGKFLGTVIETSPSCFRVSRLHLRRFWLTRELVREISDDTVRLHTHGFVLDRYSHRRCSALSAR